MPEQRFLTAASRRLALAAACAVITVTSLASAAQQTKADKILVLKEKRTLLLLREGEIVKKYRISLGRQPKGAKTRRGDGRTPEGSYTIDKRNPRSRYHLALHVSYPNHQDRARARAARVDPGGNIMIHGLPNGHGPRWKTKALTDWTAGCIAVANSDIEEIWRSVDDGVEIEIRS